MLDNFKDKVRESGKAVQEKGAETASQIRKNIHNVEEKTGEVARRFRRALSNTPEMRALRRERIRRGIQNSREMNELRAERLRANVRLSKEAVRERIEQARADLAASRKSDDTEGWLDKNFHEPVALALSRVFIRLGLHPNVVTMMSMTCGVCGGALFLPRNIWLNILGVFLQIMAAILDCCDGQVARLTDQRSQLGRVLDGVADGVNFAAVYLALGFRLTGDVIPFTNGVRWGYWVFILVFFTGLCCHASQARMADYYRIVHLFFLECRFGTDLTTSKDVRAEYEELPGDAPRYERVYLRFYANYTEKQEKATPRLQRLLAHVRASGENIPKEAAEAYVAGSRKYIQLTNLLTFGLRAYTLYALLLAGAYVWFFPFVIIVLGAMKRYMITGYEKLADEVCEKYFSTKEAPSA